MSTKTSVRDCIVDLVKASVPVFKKYSRECRTHAWEKLTSKEGDKEMKKITNDPTRPVNTFQKLAFNFKEWIIEEDR